MQFAHRHKEPADAPFPVMFRFGTLLLACVLLALNGGHSLSQAVASLCQIFGLCGLAFYFCLELAADKRVRQETETDVNHREKRLSRRLYAETTMAKIIENERLRS